EVFRDIFQINPRVQGQDFDALPSKEDTISFLRELGHTREYKAYKTYLGYASDAVPPKIARKFKKSSPSKKDRNLVPVDEEPAKKALAEKAQMKEIKKSLRDFHKTHPSGSGKVSKQPPSVEKIKPIVTNENNDENDPESEGNDEENKSDDDKIPFDNENGLDSEQDTGGSESDLNLINKRMKKKLKDDDEEEDEVIHTL
nr:hypothetical protein [Tanacetum cinerariifolium]